MGQHLINLQVEDYEHPFDKAALSKLRALPGIDTVTNFILNWAYVKWHLVELTGSNFKVTQESCPDLYNQVKKVADLLDITQLPQIYTEWGVFINAYTTGYKENTLLMLYSGAIDLMTEKELDYLIGHEMGHIKSGHVLYHMMAKMFSQIISTISIAAPLIQPIQYALLYWSRMSEFTADRAGLLASQDIDATLGSIMKMSGLPQKFFNNNDKKSFLNQAKEFEKEYSDFANASIKTISILGSSHPWTIMRAAELIKWEESGEYESILNKTRGVICPLCQKEVSIDTIACPYCGNTF